MMDELSDQLLVAFGLGDCTDEEAARVRALLSATPAEPGSAAASPPAAARLERVRQLLASLSAAHDFSADFAVSREALSSLKAIVAAPESPAAAPETPSTFSRILASLLFDSDTVPSHITGYRGSSDARTLIFVANGAEIRLRTTAQPTLADGLDSAHISVLGQIHAEEPAASVTFENVAGARLLFPVDHSGYFECTLPQGRYQLEITFIATIVSVPDVVLGV